MSDNSDFKESDLILEESDANDTIITGDGSILEVQENGVTGNKMIKVAESPLTSEKDAIRSSVSYLFLGHYTKKGSFNFFALFYICDPSPEKKPYGYCEKYRPWSACAVRAV